MKLNNQASLYFSAYPLKAISESLQAASEQSPFLKALLSGKSKTLSRVRVAPMVNPYPKTEKPAKTKTEKEKKSNVEPSGDEWYKNYE